MFDPESSKKVDARKIIALIALAGASAMAYGAGNYLSYVGVAYYVICAAAILLNFSRAGLLLWAAAGAHILLAVYSVWNWQAAGIIPCQYCFGAAGFVLIAATALYRLPAVILPVLLMTAVWLAWPSMLSNNGQTGVNQRQTKSQTIEQQALDQPVEARTESTGESGKTVPTTQTGSTAAQVETRLEQTGAATPADTTVHSGLGDGPAPDVTAEDKPGDKPGDKPEDKPGGGTAEQTPEPKPGSS